MIKQTKRVTTKEVYGAYYRGKHNNSKRKTSKGREENVYVALCCKKTHYTKKDVKNNTTNDPKTVYTKNTRSTQHSDIKQNTTITHKQTTPKIQRQRKECDNNTQDQNKQKINVKKQQKP